MVIFESSIGTPVCGVDLGGVPLFKILTVKIILMPSIVSIVINVNQPWCCLVENLKCIFFYLRQLKFLRFFNLGVDYLNIGCHVLNVKVDCSRVVPLFRNYGVLLVPL